jgi:hypothetical protein
MLLHNFFTAHFPVSSVRLVLGIYIAVSGQSSWLLNQRFRVRFPELPNFLSSSGSGTGSTQPYEDK